MWIRDSKIFDNLHTLAVCLCKHHANLLNRPAIIYTLPKKMSFIDTNLNFHHVPFLFVRGGKNWAVKLLKSDHIFLHGQLIFDMLTLKKVLKCNFFI